MKITDSSLSSSDKSFTLFAWIIYYQFEDPASESPGMLFEQLTKVVEAAYKDKLATFITKVGSIWNASLLDYFFLSSSPVNNGFVNCGGNN